MKPIYDKIYNPYMKKHMRVTDVKFNRVVQSVFDTFSARDFFVAGELERILQCINIEDHERIAENCWYAKDGINDYFSIPSNDIVYMTKTGKLIWHKARPSKGPTKRQLAIEKRRHERAVKEADKFHPEDYMYDEWD